MIYQLVFYSRLFHPVSWSNLNDRGSLLTTAHQPANDATSSWWLDPTTVGQMSSPQPEGDLRENTHSISPFSPQWRPRPVRRHQLVPLFCPPQAFLFSPSSASSFSVSLFFHPKKECPLRLSVSLLQHLFSLLIWAGIEPHPAPVQDTCSVCGSRVHAGWVAFLCMSCDQ